jgi:hypothetical protein
MNEHSFIYQKEFYAVKQKQPSGYRPAIGFLPESFASLSRISNGRCTGRRTAGAFLPNEQTLTRATGGGLT